MALLGRRSGKLSWRACDCERCFPYSLRTPVVYARKVGQGLFAICDVCQQALHNYPEAAKKLYDEPERHVCRAPTIKSAAKR